VAHEELVKNLSQGMYVFARSSRYGEPRGFFCCEWWCEGLWMSSGRYDVCTNPVIESRGRMIPRVLARPSSFPRSRLINALWPIVSRLVPRLLTRAPLGSIPPPPAKSSIVDIDTDVLVVGGGVAGLSVARELGRLNLGVTIVEGNDYLGGHLALDDVELKDVGRASDVVRNLIKDVENMSNVSVMTGVIFDGFLEDASLGHSRDYSRIYRFTYRHLIIATGAREVPIVFPGNGTPRMISGLSMLKLVKWWGFRPRSVLVWGSDDWGIRVALNLKDVGIEVHLGDNSVIVRGDVYRQRARIEGIDDYIGMNVMEARDLDNGLELIMDDVSTKYTKLTATGLLMRLLTRRRSSGAKQPRRGVRLIVDSLVSAVRVPAIELIAQLEVPIVYAPELGGLVPRRNWAGYLGVGNAYVVGEAGGLVPEHLLVKQSRVTALYIGLQLGLVSKDSYERELAEYKRDLVIVSPAHYNVYIRLEKGLHDTNNYVEPNVVHAPMWASASRIENIDRALRTMHRQYLCLCEDVTLGDVLESIRSMTGREIRVKVLHEEVLEYRAFKLPTMDKMKRFLGLGTGACQGKFCVVSTNVTLGFIFQKKCGEVGLMRFRTPVAPIPLGSLAEVVVDERGR